MPDVNTEQARDGLRKSCASRARGRSAGCRGARDRAPRALHRAGAPANPQLLEYEEYWTPPNAGPRPPITMC